MGAGQVLQYKGIPERPPSLDGLVVLGDVAPSADEAALRAALSRVGAVVRVELPGEQRAIVTFASHDDAMRAVAAGAIPALFGWLDTKYNMRSYDMRGWYARGRLAHGKGPIAFWRTSPLLA